MRVLQIFLTLIAIATGVSACNTTPAAPPGGGVAHQDQYYGEHEGGDHLR
jgi:hypothetical protein